MKALHNITRLAGGAPGKPKGYWVRIVRGKSKTKLFSDGTHDSRGDALRSALDWRDKQLSMLPARVRSSGRSSKESSRKTIKLGVPGLRIKLHDRKGTGRPYPIFEVSAQNKGEKRSQKIGITKRGVKPALFEACKALAIMQGELYAHNRQWVLQRSQSYYRVAYKPVIRVLEGLGFAQQQRTKGGMEPRSDYSQSEPITIGELA